MSEARRFHMAGCPARGLSESRIKRIKGLRGLCRKRDASIWQDEVRHLYVCSLKNLPVLSGERSEAQPNEANRSIQGKIYQL